MKKDNIFLCGFMGSGKTTVSKILAKKLGTAFWDTDEIIENMVGMPIKDIFEKYGEDYFRDSETKAIQSICCNPRSVISLGCGAGDRIKNIETIKGSGRIIFLDVNFNAVLNRLKGDSSRPLLKSRTLSELQDLYEKRQKIYLQNADIVVDANGNPMEVCYRIIKKLKSHLA